MTIKGKKELVELLDEISNNCGDIRGRDGEYLSDVVLKASEMAENLSIEES